MHFIWPTKLTARYLKTRRPLFVKAGEELDILLSEQSMAVRTITPQQHGGPNHYSSAVYYNILATSYKLRSR